MLNPKNILFFTLLLAIISCSLGTTDGEDDDEDTDTGTTITIDNMTFDSVDFTAEPGETITVVNDDSDSHTVTSESDEDEFDDSGDFDTGTISPGETDSFTIPSDAQDGDIFFFYCDLHTSSMETPNGTITIEE